MKRILLLAVIAAVLQNFATAADTAGTGTGHKKGQQGHHHRHGHHHCQHQGQAATK